jgi:hypothetical protein
MRQQSAVSVLPKFVKRYGWSHAQEPIACAYPGVLRPLVW